MEYKTSLVTPLKEYRERISISITDLDSADIGAALIGASKSTASQAKIELGNGVQDLVREILKAEMALPHMKALQGLQEIQALQLEAEKELIAELPHSNERRNAQR
jgi:hypothetical protein